MFKKGFTLVELLIVIAILGALAAVVLVAMNPAEQLARARDSGRVNSISALGRSMEAYATSHSGSYVTYGAAPDNYSWVTKLVDAGEMPAVPTSPTYTASTFGGCANNIGSEGNWCYIATTGSSGTGPILIYTSAESKSAKSKCPAASPYAWVAYSSNHGRAGTTCTADAATKPAISSSSTYFVD